MEEEGKVRGKIIREKIGGMGWQTRSDNSF
jgi:hypothetical protein